MNLSNINVGAPRERTVIAEAFKKVVEAMPAWCFPSKSTEELLARLVNRALPVYLWNDGLWAGWHYYFRLIEEVSKANRGRSVHIALPIATKFIKLVRIEIGRRWFDKKYRSLAPRLSAFDRTIRSSALRQFCTFEIKVVCRNRPESRYPFCEWGDGLMAQLKRLSFERGALGRCCSSNQFSRLIEKWQRSRLATAGQG